MKRVYEWYSDLPKRIKDSIIAAITIVGFISTTLATLHVPYRKALIESALKDDDFKVQTMARATQYHYKLTPIMWQHHGNKKSDSLYYLNNEKNTNTLS